MDLTLIWILVVFVFLVLGIYLVVKKKNRPIIKEESRVSSIEEKIASVVVPRAISWSDRLFKGLEKSRQGVWQKIFTLNSQNQEKREEMEEILYSADLPPQIVSDLLDRVSLKDEQTDIVKNIYHYFHDSLYPVQKLKGDIYKKNQSGPKIIMIVGVNGVGKTTTIGKLATQFKAHGHRVLVGACDTFRAAAVDQLEVWCQRAQVDLVRAAPNVDPSGVAFDTVAKAYKENYDVCLIDTAGRLHNNVNLMEELAKTKRVMAKINADAPHEVFLVIDAITGQNAIRQAQEFHKSLGLTGLILTKCDGSAKAGSAIYIIKELKVPVYFVGVGENVEDLDQFDLDLYLGALLGQTTQDNYLK